MNSLHKNPGILLLIRRDGIRSKLAIEKVDYRLLRVQPKCLRHPSAREFHCGESFPVWRISDTFFLTEKNLDALNETHGTRKMQRTITCIN